MGIDMERFVPQVGYSLELNHHSRVNLAFRCGIACEESHITAYFEQYIKSPKNDSEKSIDTARPNPKSHRDACYFTINGQKKIHTIMQGHKVITAYPPLKVFNTSDAIHTLQIFETSIQLSPNIFTMQEVVDWREKYLDSNGLENKDTLRREIYKRMPKLLTPMEMLGLSDSFFDEVKQLRKYVRDQIRWRAASSLDFSDKEAIEEHTKKQNYLQILGKNKFTEFWEETPEYGELMRKDWEGYQNSDEYKRHMQELHEDQTHDVLLVVLEDGEAHQKRLNNYRLSDNYLKLSQNERDLKEIEIQELSEKNYSVWLDRQRRCDELDQIWSKIQRSDDYLYADQEYKDTEKQKHESLKTEINPLWRSSVTSKPAKNIRPNEKPDPVHGVPFGQSPADHFNGKPCFFHGDCIVTHIEISEWKNGWHALHYENSSKRFITTTNQKWIIEKYRVGQRGVWTLEQKEGTFHVQQPMGGMDGADDFYISDEWQRLRYQKLKNSPKKCELCGSNEELHVDHKDPRSLRPDLELELSNLQILCKACNLGKGNSDATDISDIPF